MKKHLLVTTVAIILSVIATDVGAQMSREAQLELIGYYKLVLEGRAGVPSESQALLELDDSNFPIKCGTPITISYISNFKYFDKDLIDKYSLALPQRPTETNEFFDSPAGYFKIHFTRTGSHAVYQPTSTTGGIPDFVIGTARVFDSVFNYIVGVLGYPAPPSDGSYPSGIDNRYDIYMVNLNGVYYGQTFADSAAFSGPLDATSFILIDNDYQEGGFGPYRSNPLNAVRVTAAHEFFHAIHFAIDRTEMENYTDPNFARPYWFEMSATWMEEEIYDDINDYYAYIPFFFNSPRSSIQQFSSGVDFHPYASCVFPIFLSEKFGSDIIRAIWIKCGQLGIGPSMLEAADIVIDSVTSGTENFRSVFGEFTLWNFFTGSRAALAPIGVGYEERAFYPEIPESSFTSVNQYPAFQDAFLNPKRPSVNSAQYFKLNNTRAIFYTDSADTQLRVSLAFGGVTSDSALPQGWSVHRIAQLDSNANVYFDSGASYSDNGNHFLRTNNPRQYRSITYVLAPASFKWEAYTSSDYDTRFGYIITDSLVDSLIDTVITIDTAAVEIEANILTAYPNPAVVSQMGGQNLRFRFQIPTDSLSIPLYLSPYCVADIYTLAGEYVKTLETTADPYVNPDPYVRTVRFEIDWDMRSERGEPVASGVYLCVLRLYSSDEMSELLAEDKTKVLIVR